MVSFKFTKQKRLVQLLAATVLFTQSCYAGYAISDDCKPRPIFLWTCVQILTSLGTGPQRDFLEQALASAGTLAALGQSYTSQYFNPDGTQVFEWLYGTEGLDMMRQSVQTNLAGVQENTRPVEGELRGGDSTTADVRIFCSHDRLRKGNRNGQERDFDPSIKQFLTNKLDCSTAMAFTIIPDGRDADQPDTIQICPWFLDYAMAQSTQFVTNLKPSVVPSMIMALKLDKLAAWAKFTPIDLFQLFDKVIVHELSHTRRGGQTDDVHGFGGYGWKECRKLSTNRGGTDAPHRNADSLALFASISGLLSRGGMVNEDGTFARGPREEKREMAAFDAASLKARPLWQKM